MVSTHSEALAAGADAILTASDLALFCDRNPALLLRLVREASCVAELAPLLRQAGRMVLDGLAQSSDVDDCAYIATEIVAASAAACIRFAHQDAVSAGMDAPSARILLAGVRHHGAGRSSAAGASQDRRRVRR